MRAFAPAILWLLLSVSAFADGLTVSVESPGPILATLALPADAEHTVKWESDAGAKFVRSTAGDRAFVWAHPGEHWVEAKVTTYIEILAIVVGPNYETDKSDHTTKPVRIPQGEETYRKTFVVEGHAPNPPPVTPTPTTPVVTPVDPNAPAISVDGFHVLFLYSDATTPALYELLNDPQVRAYLDSHCLGGAAGWRIWENDVPIANAPPVFKEIRGHAKSPLPSVNIAANKRVIQSEVPKTAAELLTLLKLHGGA